MRHPRAGAERSSQPRIPDPGRSRPIFPRRILDVALRRLRFCSLRSTPSDPDLGAESAEVHLARRLVPLGILLGTLLAFSAPATAQNAEDAPPEPEETALPVPPELSSARATMTTFLQAFDERFRLPGVDPLEQAAGCLDLSEIPPEVRSIRGKDLAGDLKDVLDRTELIRFEEVSDDSEGEPHVIPVGKSGRIVLRRVADGRWLFSTETVSSVTALWREVQEEELLEGVVREGPTTWSAWLRSWIPQSLQRVGFLLEHWQWLALLVLIFFGLLFDRILSALMRAAVRRHLDHRIRALDHGQLVTILRPVGLLAAALVWWFGLFWLVLPPKTLAVLVVAARFVAAAALVWAAYRLVDMLAAVLETRAGRTENKIDDLLVPLVRKSFKVFIAVFGLIFVADTLSLPISSLLTGVGIGGLALALAAQDAVKNLFGSLMVITDQPFHVGDWVVIGDVEGSVAEVGFRSTRIKTFYDSVITLPNANLINASVDNRGARTYRRWSTTLSVAYDTPAEKIEAFCEGIRELIRRHPYTRKDSFHVYLNQFSASSLDVLLYMFFRTPEWGTELRERHRLALDILRLAEDLGVEFAFPTQTLYLQRPRPGGEPAPAGGYGDRVRDIRRQAKDKARELVDGALGGKIPPPVGPEDFGPIAGDG